MIFQDTVPNDISFNCWTLLITWNHHVVSSVFVAGAPRFDYFAEHIENWWCLKFSLSLVCRVFILIWTEGLYSSAAPELVSCIVYILIQTSNWSVPLLPWGPFRPCQHFSPERGNLPPSHLSQSFYMSPSSFHFTQRWKRKNPTLHSQEAWLFLLLFSLSDSFTHSVWHQPSPLLPLSLPLYTAFISMCVYTCSFHRLRGGSLWGENEGRCASAADFSHTGAAKRW